MRLYHDRYCADLICFTCLYRRKTEPSDYDCLCDQHTGVRAAWSKMGEQRKRKNAEPRNRNRAVCTGIGDAVLLKLNNLRDVKNPVRFCRGQDFCVEGDPIMFDISFSELE